MDRPLYIFQPFNGLVYFVFFSPIIVATGITSLSFVFQNFKGLIYLGFLLAACVARSYAYFVSGAEPSRLDGTVCNAVQYTRYGNPAFSTFVSAFTLTYLAYPMFANDAVNYWVFSTILVYALLDVALKWSHACYTDTTDLAMNAFGGGVAGLTFVLAMYAGGSGQYLFFNEVASDKEVCYRPTNQTFKCQMYRNGELIHEL